MYLVELDDEAFGLDCRLVCCCLGGVVICSAHERVITLGGDAYHARGGKPKSGQMHPASRGDTPFV